MRTTIKDVTIRLWKDERGASLLEYSILIGLITVGVVGSVTQVGGWIGEKWTALKTALGIGVPAGT
jgi:pilus assembly protein Flp/PilA